MTEEELKEYKKYVNKTLKQNIERLSLSELDTFVYITNCYFRRLDGIDKTIDCMLQTCDI